MRIRIVNEGDSKFKNWTKKVSKVNLTKTNGYAFEGKFLESDKEYDLDEGDVLLFLENFGSRAKTSKEASIKIVKNGQLETYDTYDYSSDFLDLRDKIAELLNQKPNQPNPLARFTDEEILGEVKKRGLM